MDPPTLPLRNGVSNSPQQPIRQQPPRHNPLHSNIPKGLMRRVPSLADYVSLKLLCLEVTLLYLNILCNI